MELAHGPRNVSKCASEDFISSMPDNVITDILGRLPLRHAVRTSILSRNWRFNWTLRTGLRIYDDDFFRLLRWDGRSNYNVNFISRLLHQLKGPITSFSLDIPEDENEMPDAEVPEDVHHCLMLLSKRGIKRLTILSSTENPLKLSSQFFYCMELQYLDLLNCCFHPPPTFRGFPKLLSLQFTSMKLQSNTLEDFIAHSTLLECLIVREAEVSVPVKLIEIAKHGNLKILYLELYTYDDTTVITDSSIFELAVLSKLKKLNLDISYFKLLAEDGVKTKVPTSFLCLKTLTITIPDLSDDVMLSFLIEMICRSPNLQELDIRGRDFYNQSSALSSLDLDSNTMGQLQLQSVQFADFIGSDYEVCLIKLILACCPLLKKIVIKIHLKFVEYHGESGKFQFAHKLLKLRRASPLAEMLLY